MKSSERRQPWLLTALLWSVLIAIGIYFAWFKSSEPPPAPEIAVEPKPMEEPPPVRYPIEAPPIEKIPEVVEQEPSAPEPPPEPPLPKLFESDSRVLAMLHDFVPNELLQPVLVPQHIIARMVTTIDNLTPEKLAINALPVRPVPGTMDVRQSGDEIFLSDKNSQRYAGYIKLLENADTDTLVSLYKKLYPLFQESYRDLGKNAYFNDRLIDVIDHLLAAPEPQGPVKLVQPKVFYEYADPELEAASAGQKVLIRVGPENAAKIKAKLRDIRAQLALNSN